LDKPKPRRGRPPKGGTKPDAEPRRRERGSMAVYEAMREDILTLKIRPGSALDEVALAARYGLSRTPIREALLMLQREDLVTFLPSRSAIVTPHTMSNAHEYMDTLMLLSRAIARIAAEVRSPEALARIRECQESYERVSLATDIDAIVAADLVFHRAISLASGNEFLGKFYDLSLDYGRRMHILHYYPLFGRAERDLCVAEHAAIVEALEKGDAERAETLVGEHVMSELRVVQRSLEPKVGTKFALGGGWRTGS
jgi:DNA-binding GntR family transcriptional regulator